MSIYIYIARRKTAPEWSGHFVERPKRKLSYYSADPLSLHADSPSLCFFLRSPSSPFLSVVIAAANIRRTVYDSEI